MLMHKCLHMKKADDDLRAKGLLAGVDAQDGLSCSDIWQPKVHLAVKTARPPQCWIN